MLLCGFFFLFDFSNYTLPHSTPLHSTPPTHPSTYLCRYCYHPWRCWWNFLWRLAGWPSDAFLGTAGSVEILRRHLHHHTASLFWTLLGMPQSDSEWYFRTVHVIVYSLIGQHEHVHSTCGHVCRYSQWHAAYGTLQRCLQVPSLPVFPRVWQWSDLLQSVFCGVHDTNPARSIYFFIPILQLLVRAAQCGSQHHCGWGRGVRGFLPAKLRQARLIPDCFVLHHVWYICG